MQDERREGWSAREFEVLPLCIGSIFKNRQTLSICSAFLWVDQFVCVDVEWPSGACGFFDSHLLGGCKPLEALFGENVEKHHPSSWTHVGDDGE